MVPQPQVQQQQVSSAFAKRNSPGSEAASASIISDGMLDSLVSMDAIDLVLDEEPSISNMRTSIIGTTFQP